MEVFVSDKNHDRERLDELPIYDMINYEQLDKQPVYDQPVYDEHEYDEPVYDEIMDFENTTQLNYIINNIILSAQKKQTQLQSILTTLEQLFSKFYYDWYNKYRMRRGDQSSMDYWKTCIEPHLLRYDHTIQNYKKNITEINKECNDSLTSFIVVCNEVDLDCVDVVTLEDQFEELIQNVDLSIEKLNRYIIDVNECMKTLNQYYYEWMDSIPDEIISIIFGYWNDKHNLKYGTMAQLNKRWNNIIMSKYSTQYKHDKERREIYISRCRKSAYRMGKLLLDRKHLMFDEFGLNEQFILSKYDIMGLYADLDMNVHLAMTELTKNLKFTIFSLEFNYYEDHIKSTINKHYEKFVNFCEKFFPTYGKTMVRIMMETASAVVEDDNTLLKYLM